MDWFKKHSDAIAVLSTLVGAFLWMNGRFNEIDSRFNQLEKDTAVIKAVLVMKNIMPSEVAHCSEEK